MKHSEAVRHLEAMLRTIQRFRSISKEELTGGSWTPEVVQAVLEDLFPWVHTEKCPIPILVQVLDRVERGEQIEPLFLYNMVYIATRLEPALSAMIYAIGGDHDFPEEANSNWLHGWEPEV